MTPEQKAEAMRLAQAYALAISTNTRLHTAGRPTTQAMQDVDTANRSLDSYLTALIDKPTIARIDGEGSSSLD